MAVFVWLGEFGGEHGDAETAALRLAREEVALPLGYGSAVALVLRAFVRHK